MLHNARIEVCGIATRNMSASQINFSEYNVYKTFIKLLVKKQSVVRGCLIR